MVGVHTEEAESSEYVRLSDLSGISDVIRRSVPGRRLTRQVDLGFFRPITFF